MDLGCYPVNGALELAEQPAAVAFQAVAKDEGMTPDAAHVLEVEEDRRRRSVVCRRMKAVPSAVEPGAVAVAAAVAPGDVGDDEGQEK